MHDRTASIQARVRRALDERLRPAIFKPAGALDVAAWHVDGGQGEPVPFTAARQAAYEPFAVGERWGPAWGTTWFHLTGPLPAPSPAGPLEIVCDLGWIDDSAGFQAEGLVYRPDGSVVKGLNPLNDWIPLSGTSIDLYVEAAANPRVFGPSGFRPTPLGEKSTAGPDPLYRLRRAEICVRNVTVWELVADLEVLEGLRQQLPADDGWRAEVLLGLERALDLLDARGVTDGAHEARLLLAPLLERRAAQGAHRVSAIGHAHIDSAWLWPIRETVRKVARTVANVTDLLDSEPNLVYAMSSAQQYEWLEEHRPEVFARLAEAVRDGRFVPVGGMWVESDTNMVGGEAMARQFVFGQGYFRDRFGITCQQVWLPDSFGYSAGLPQIVRQAGCTAFLTQKISWNAQNVFPHHTFWWEGIDGTRVFTHFPPVDTYCSDLSPAELAHAASNFRDKGATNASLVPFGWGDGGGGPTREMMQRAVRQRDLEGSPRVSVEPPAAFFESAVRSYPNAPVWVGELYLEFHRGTYTSQACTKEGNRRCEHLLREAELWATTAAVRGLRDYPVDELRSCWKIVLLNQFHDILPGSSIAWVHREAAQQYAEVSARLESLIDDPLTALVADGSEQITCNATPFTSYGVPALSGAFASSEGDRARASQLAGGGVLLDNGVIRVTIDAAGTVTSLVDITTGREVVPPQRRANLLQLHPDLPNRWDAWDIDEHYRHSVTDLVECGSLSVDTTPDGGATVTVARSFGSSRIAQTMTLQPGARQLDCFVAVDWHEAEKVLKVAIPIDVHTTDAAFETQFGHLRRPTHTNTSWDAARFEVCAHRFVHVGEPDFGVAVVNSATYGHDVTRSDRPGGGTFSTVRMSLLRAPRFPDPQTDQGHHERRYAIVVAPSVADAVEAGYRINLPARVMTGQPFEPLVRVEGPGVVAVEAIKLAEDGSGDVIVRLYEPLGRRAEVTLHPTFDVTAARQVDILEDDCEPDGFAWATDHATLALRPFQIMTIRLARS